MDQAGIAAADIDQPHPPLLDGPEALRDGVSIPDGVQEFPAHAVDVEGSQLRAQIVGSRCVGGGVAAGFDDERRGEQSVDALAQDGGGLALGICQAPARLFRDGLTQTG